MSRTGYVIGHRQPDTDAICAAIAYARLKRAQGTDLTAARAGALNPETEFVLDRWDADVPVLLEDATNERLLLVDHNEYGQAVSGAADARITAVVDHHRIGDVRTGEPIFFLNEPVGSTATILAELYDDAGVEIDVGTAGLLLSGVLSDTVVSRSPTTTDRDRAVADRLAETAGVEIERYGRELLHRKSELGEKSPREMALGDFKEFEFGPSRVGIGQVETVDPAVVLDRRAAVLAAMDDVVAERGYAAFVLLVTDVLAEDSTALVAGEHVETVAGALGAEFTDREAMLPGVMSRKKQVVPPLEEAFR